MLSYCSPVKIGGSLPDCYTLAQLHQTDSMLYHSLQ